VRTLSLADRAGPAAQTAGLVISVSTGVSDMPGSSSSQDEIVVHADAALYAAKAMRSVGRQAAPAVAVAATADAPAPRLDQTVRGIAVAIDARDGATSSHSDDVAACAHALGERLGLAGDELAGLQRAAQLHDAGKIGIPDAVLLKPGPLTSDERTVMQRHSALGYRIMLAAGLPEREALWVLHHHEHIDGSGYPHGLHGDEIPLASRILLVADAFQALTAARPYRAARSPEAALAELRRCAGTQFDRAVVDALVAVVGEKVLSTPPPDAPAAVVEGPHWRLSEGVAG
jgi:HD-GYP domain-containing protein (c-di-GMP phosphodiesterase class II)